MSAPAAGTFQWDRGLTFLQQVDEPFRQDIEPAMLWRQLPALVCHYAGLRSRTAFLFPWLGAFTAVVYVAVVAARQNPAPRFVWGCTLLYASSAALLVPAHWFGINDGWIWLGLLAVAFGRSTFTPVIAILLCPWVDERFLIALPVALLIRGRASDPAFCWKHFTLLVWILPYALIRVGFLGVSGGALTSEYLGDRAQMLIHLAPFAPLGWWMALRGGWVPAGYAAARYGWSIAVASILALLACFVVAYDISRSAAVLAPLMLAGCFEWHRVHPADAARQIWWLALINLLLPAVHVVHDKIDLINPLPIELIRLWQGIG
ncbi:MAG: hypothetical protein IT582_11385 [Opitutaceae bacterium]|nr:hypothetical protein [Opitutaceae bacterium]